jgi:tetratricopeptide (TPR) repeat protein
VNLLSSSGMRQNGAVTVFLASLIACLLLPAPSPAQPQEVRAREAYDRAVALEAEGNQAAALSLLWAAAGAAPRDADIQNRLGEALDRIGALQGAVDAYRRAIASRADFGRAMNNLVVALSKSGQGAEAVRLAENWAAGRPSDPDRLFTVALAQSEQDVDAAMGTLRQVVARRPAHALSLYNLALLLKRVDRVDEALEAARRAAAIDPRPETQRLLGSLYAQRGDLARAETAVEAATAVDPRQDEAWLQLATIRQSRGDVTRAVDAVRRAIALSPDAWRAQAMLATLLRQSGDEAGARRASANAERRRTAEQAERAAVVMTTVGIARLDAGDAEGARERFAAAVATAEGYAPAYYHLGRALQRLRRFDASRQAFDRARQLNPSLVPPDDSRWETRR